MGGGAQLIPLPLFAGEEGPKPKAWEVRVLLTRCYRPSPPTRFTGGPLLSREGRERFRGPVTPE
jgi:hypothetical protein